MADTPQLNLGEDYWNKYRTYSVQAPASTAGSVKDQITDSRRYSGPPLHISDEAYTRSHTYSARNPNDPATKLDTTDLSGSQRDAASALLQLFNQYGLGSLGPKIIDFVKKGYGADTIALLLQDTNEWKQRFAGNEIRRKAGLPILSPAEYLATERSYAQVLQQFGFPKGFYDSPSDFANMIGRDLSPTELQNRAQIASDFAMNHDPAALEAAKSLYGFGPGEVAAYALDPKRALPLLQKQAQAVSVATAAMRRGLSANRGVAEHLVDLGVTGQQAEAGYSQIADMLPTFEELGKIYGEGYNQSTAEAEVFGGDAGAAKKRKSLASQERAAFSGSSRGQVGNSSRSQSY